MAIYFFRINQLFLNTHFLTDYILREFLEKNYEFRKIILILIKNIIIYLFSNIRRILVEQQDWVDISVI